MVTAGGVLFKKLKRDGVKNIKQFTAVIIITFLASCLFNGFISNSLVFKTRVDQLYTRGNIADLWVYTVTGDADINRIKKADGVEDAEGRFVVSAVSEGSPINLMAISGDPEISKPFGIEGDSGFLLEKVFAKDKNLEVGDSFIVEIPVPQVLKDYQSLFSGLKREDGRDILSDGVLKLEFIVTGLMSHPECVDSGTFALSYAITDKQTVANAVAELLNSCYKLDSYLSAIKTQVTTALTDNQYVVKVKDGADKENVRGCIVSAFSDKADNNLLGVYTVNEISTNAGVMSDISQSQKMTLVFPVIFFAVALLVVLTTVSQLIIREKMQIGAMKAIGVPAYIIYAHYILLPLLPVSAGFILGAVAGPLIIPAVMNIKYSILFSLPPAQIIYPVWQTFLSFAVFIFITAIVCYSVCRSEVILLPAESMRQGGNTVKIRARKIKAKKLKWTFVPLKMAVRNIFITKARSVMVIAGVAGCTALLICAFGIDNTLDYGVKNDTQYLYSKDIEVIFNGESQQITDNAGVELSENFAYYPASASADAGLSQTKIRVIDGNSKFCLIKFDKSGVAVSEKVADECGVKEGGVIKFTVLGESYSATVTAVYDAFYYHGIVADSSLIPELYAKSNGTWIKLKEGADAEEICLEIKQNPSAVSAVSSSEFKKQADSLLSSISYMTATLKFFAIGLAVVVLYNIALLNFRERQRDIATLKVIGLTKAEIAASLISEIMILSFLGTFLGMFLGFPMTVLTLSINETSVVSFLYHINTFSYLFSALISLGTAFVVNLMLSLFIDRVQMVESLKSYE